MEADVRFGFTEFDDSKMRTIEVGQEAGFNVFHPQFGEEIDVVAAVFSGA